MPALQAQRKKLRETVKDVITPTYLNILLMQVFQRGQSKNINFRKKRSTKNFPIGCIQQNDCRIIKKWYCSITLVQPMSSVPLKIVLNFKIKCFVRSHSRSNN